MASNDKLEYMIKLIGQNYLSVALRSISERQLHQSKPMRNIWTEYMNIRWKHLIFRPTLGIKYIIFGIAIFFSSTGVAQVINEEPEIKALKSYFRTYYSQHETIRGYRIQISSTTDRREMERDLNRFKNIYPSMYYEWKHTAPYYRVIVGAFLTKKEAQAKIHSLRRQFGSSVLVFDDITKEELLD